MRIELFSYRKCFKRCAKLRPGFTLNGITYCLTHTRPESAAYVEIPKTTIKSPHFKSEEHQSVYLTKALPTAVRFNNLSGGELCLNPILLSKLGLLLQSSLKDIFLISLTNDNIMSVQKSLLELLFLSDIAFPETQAELGLSTPIVGADNKELSPFQVWEKVRAFDAVEHADRISFAAPAINTFKKLTTLRALEMCPAFNTTHSQAAVVALAVDKYDEVLANLAAVLENNPLTNEVSMNALVGLSGVFGEADLKVYEPVESIDPASLAAIENGEAPADAATAPTAETSAEPASEQAASTEGETAPAMGGEAAAVEEPVADKALVVAQTAAPALSQRELIMLNSRTKSAQKLVKGIQAFTEALSDEMDGLVAATNPELPAEVPA